MPASGDRGLRRHRRWAPNAVTAGHEVGLIAPRYVGVVDDKAAPRTRRRSSRRYTDHALNSSDAAPDRGRLMRLDPLDADELHSAGVIELGDFLLGRDEQAVVRPTAVNWNPGLSIL